jgi:hypothetical protein
MDDDWFERFESKVAGFTRNHKLSILLVSGILIGILIFTMLLGVICIPLAFSLAEQNQTERYNAHYPPTHEDYLSDETITNWNNLVVPTVTFLIGYLYNSVIIIGVGYLIIVNYFLIRWGWRVNERRKLAMVIE